MAPHTEPIARDSTEGLIFLVLGAAGVTGLLYAAGWTSAHLAGHPTPRGGPLAELAAFGHAGDPSKAWGGSPVGPPVLYWFVTALFVVVVGLLAWLGYRLAHGSGLPHRGTGTRKQEVHDGLAERADVSDLAGEKALMRQARTLRPSLDHPAPHDVGYRLGKAWGLDVWASVEDSMLLLGPPRAGKGYHVVIPMILDAPGAVITTSTRPDNLTVTMAARARHGPVAVFDPQGLAPATGLIPVMRWSPIRGCEKPSTAMLRALALIQGGEGGVENGGFWKQQSQSAIQCLLHAAAIGGKSPADLYRWSHTATGAKEAVAILVSHADAALGWGYGLDATIGMDQRTRDSIWAMISNAFSPLADPAVLAAVSPRPGDEFTPTSFIQAKGTLYLLGTAAGASATGNLVAALIEDVVDAARRLAARSTGARLDPPLTLVLDEAANYPLPSLPSLMSEGGGTGITTLAVLQSLAQSRDKWGRESAAAIWDSAIVKVILGGGSDASDLADLSRLIGEREYVDMSVSRGSQPGISTNTSVRTQAIMDPSDIRLIGFGHGLLLLRASKPIMLELAPWTSRHDRKALHEAKAIFEQAMLEGARANA